MFVSARGAHLVQRSKVYYNIVYMFNDVSLGLDFLTQIVPPN